MTVTVSLTEEEQEMLLSESAGFIFLSPDPERLRVHKSIAGKIRRAREDPWQLPCEPYADEGAAHPWQRGITG